MKQHILMKSAFLLFLFTLVLVLSGCTQSPEKTLEELKQAVEDRDYITFYELVDKDDDVYWTEKQAQSMIEDFHDNREDYAVQLELLQQQAMALKEDNPLINEEGMLYFNKDEQLKVRTYAVTAEEGLLDGVEKLSVKIDDEKELNIDANKNDTLKLGLFGPGEYSFEAAAEYPYADVKNKGEFYVSGVSDFNQAVELGLEGKYIGIASHIPDTKLFINGKDANVNISELDGGEMNDESLFGSTLLDHNFGPISEGISLQGVAKMPWGKIKSEEVKITSDTKSYDLSPKILQDKKAQKKVTELINNYQKDKMTALVNLDDKHLKNLSNSFKKSLSKEIIQAKEQERTYAGQVLGTRIDYSKALYEEGEGGRHYVTIPIELHRTYVERYFFNKDEEPTEEYEHQEIKLEYISDKEEWIIDQEDSYYGADEDDYMKSEEVVETEF
ncbi:MULTISPECIES: TcaA 3rd/4th domain-containing protein [Virgibacillus]|uniref:DUF5105 domain-containing protein n=1 Tax=Virgibacillus pantothenticus TaxID=1473 RepID=A0A0L0QM98_VIRPA|nr:MULTISPECIES: hypothetical protein [Virgibacillus]API93096.1 hypothetical protein BKP57_15540 [Virgibacillus sp. 6R]KNE19393.1 hypothetical protein AFK71_12895 [Virgibacillus pantothenticus]MBS7427038.1 hypothetical protein [Virgibacillus sp. 19R1-5]MED3738786.1 hypothetical protein [Virgibacillus pantothenticus]QTY15091.1 hypothetical protein KBP50_14365 [Virgibacillus pantothenticus]